MLSVSSKCFLCKISIGVLSALLQRLKRWGVRLLVLRPCAALYIKLVCLAVTPGGSLFWRWYARKPPNSLLKTCQQNTWITGTMSYGLMRWRLICLVLMGSSMCGGNQVRSTKISVSCLQSSIVVGMSWSKAAWVLQVLKSYISLRGNMNSNIYCEILQPTMIPSLQKLGRRAVFQWLQTHLQDDHCFTEEAKGKAGQACVLTWTQ